MKRLILAALLSATPALAGETTPMTTYTNVICIGVNACSQATFQHCAVALGRGAKLDPEYVAEWNKSCNVPVA